MRRSSTRQARKARPGLEGLEGRQLLSSGINGTGSAGSVERQISVTLSNNRRMTYTTPQGTKVVITVYGVGSLAGSTVDPDGALNLVFSGTNELTGIIARTSGGTGQAPLRSIRNADLGLDNFSGIGSTVLDVVNFKNFNLVDGGQVNLTAGVHTFLLNSAGENTQIHIRALPSAFTSGTSTSTSNGVTEGFIANVAGARTLTSLAGTPVVTNFAALAGSTTQSSTTIGVNPGPPPAPPGAIVSIGSIRGRPLASSVLSDPEVYGYDPVANTMDRFDATTGALLQSIPLSGMGTMTTGVALGRVNRQLVALVGNGTTVFVFNALNGAPMGQFSTADLAANGINSIDGIGSTDNMTVLTDSRSGSGGVAQLIDVTASLAAGQAVAVGAPFSPTREFGFSGGASGIGGSNTIYVTGAGHFDSAQPNLTQFGIMAINTTGGQLKESSRTALMSSSGNFINTGPMGTAQSMPFQALGSIDENLALVTGVSNGQNVVTLLNPSTQARAGTVRLNDPNQLVGLSESFRPDLVDTALVEIQGTLQSFRAVSAQGLVFNDIGAANLVKIQNASDSTFVALPFAHAEIPHRSNVTILSSGRSVDGRNGVTIQSNLQPIGPLSLPTPGPPSA